MGKQSCFALAVCLALIAAGCQQAPPPSPKPDLKAEAAKIKELDDAWLKAFQAKDAAAHASFFAEDGSSYTSGRPKAVGREAIRKQAEEVFKSEVSSSWETPTIVVSEAGDLAYALGTWESVIQDAKGKRAKEVGKFLTVWKKQPDGNWKVLADSGSPDGPPTPLRQK
jgi:uncharacterized protein (TIGR02246 family)